MRKNFFATMIVAVIGAFAGYNIYQSQNTNTLSDLVLANVEALASGEGSGNYKCVAPFTAMCSMEGSIRVPGYKQ